jgi:hypothetical protein
MAVSTIVEEEDESGPSLEQILASTTKKAQPIRALERMRQVERTAMKRAEQRAELRHRKHGKIGGTGRGGRELGYGGSGTLDVFAVLAQVNEQLSSASDLQTFLDVVVGIIKDLTQFHRVLIHQFDEAANGQASSGPLKYNLCMWLRSTVSLFPKVVAELVDWTKTHELYRGLHFPASDIPLQARELYRISTCDFEV